MKGPQVRYVVPRKSTAHLHFPLDLDLGVPDQHQDSVDLVSELEGGEVVVGLGGVDQVQLGEAVHSSSREVRGSCGGGTG